MKPGVSASLKVKVCGVTRIRDAEMCVEAGVDAIGLNFWVRSKRRCDPEVARKIASAVGGRVRMVAVVVNADARTLREIRDEVGIPWIQFHGDEPAEAVSRYLPNAYRAVSLQESAAMEQALQFPGSEILVDSAPASVRGGTGEVGNWGLARRVAARRRTWLAGGIRPSNVLAARRAVCPYGVDCASGVESHPGIKSEALVRELIEVVRTGVEEAGRLGENARNPEIDE